MDIAINSMHCFLSPYFKNASYTLFGTNFETHNFVADYFTRVDAVNDHYFIFSDFKSISTIYFEHCIGAFKYR